MQELLVNCRNGATLERDAGDWPVIPPRRRQQVPSHGPAGVLEAAALAGIPAVPASQVRKAEALARLREHATDPVITDLLTLLGIAL